MPFREVVPVLDPRVRDLCSRPYPNHPFGCPNFHTRGSCPPTAPWLTQVFDLNHPSYVIWTQFNLRDHVARMQRKHPDWSDRQLVCCLYWQGTARKRLNEEIARFNLEEIKGKHRGYIVTKCPEAMGMNVTATMDSIRVKLEWPPIHWATHVAFAGWPQE